MRRTAVVALLVAVPIALVVAAAAFLEIQARLPQAPAPGHRPACAAPCADAGGYAVTVADVRSTPGMVVLDVTLHVRGRSNMHTTPDDFTLREGGHTYRPAFGGAGCPRWARTQLGDPSTFGPEPLCFRPASTASPLVLHWDPDLGISEYFSGGYDIRVG